MKKYLIATLLLGFVLTWMGPKVMGQEKEYIYQTFRGTRLINGHTVETQKEGELELIISHRFGRINGGLYELFGLDQASMRIGFEYGIQNWLAVGVGRSTLEKTYDGFIKAKLLSQQTSGMPITLTYLGTSEIRGLRDTDPVRSYYFTSRMFYTHQLLLARKFSDRLSLQLMPTFVHRNYVPSERLSNDIYLVGGAIRYKVTKSMAVTVEYYHPVYGTLADNIKPSLAVGYEIETNGHVFQLQFTNSLGMNNKAFLTETTGDWMAGDIHFGFNMSRIFKTKGRWY
jgi:hypothetical protein